MPWTRLPGFTLCSIQSQSCSGCPRREWQGDGVTVGRGGGRQSAPGSTCVPVPKHLVHPCSSITAPAALCDWHQNKGRVQPWVAEPALLMIGHHAALPVRTPTCLVLELRLLPSGRPSPLSAQACLDSTSLCQIDRLSLPRAAGRPDTCSYSYTPSYNPPTQMFSPNCYKFDCFPISLFCQIYFSLFTHLVSFHLKRTSCKKALSWSPAIQCQSCALILAIWYFNEILDYQQEYIGCRLYLPSCYLKVAGKWLTSKPG